MGNNPYQSPPRSDEPMQRLPGSEFVETILGEPGPPSANWITLLTVVKTGSRDSRSLGNCKTNQGQIR